MEAELNQSVNHIKWTMYITLSKWPEDMISRHDFIATQ